MRFLFLAPYVKVYVMEGKRCLVKKKTRTARRTLEPLYQQQLEFKVEFTGKTLQVNNKLAFFVWAFVLREAWSSGQGAVLKIHWARVQIFLFDGKREPWIQLSLFHFTPNIVEA